MLQTRPSCQPKTRPSCHCPLSRRLLSSFSSTVPGNPAARLLPPASSLLTQIPAPLPRRSPLPAATAVQPAGVRVGMMKKTTCKGRGKNMARLNKKQNASKTVLKQRPIHPGIASEDDSGDLVEFCESSSINLTKQIESKLSESVVSLASFNGRTPVFECTGIFIENLMDTIQILTSANLVGSVSEGITDNLTIKVRLPSDQVAIGSLHRCDFKYDLAVVNIRCTRGIHIQEAHLSSSHPVQFESNSKVVAVERCFSKGMFKFTNGIVIGPASDEPRKLMISTHKMNTALSGYPLIDFDGNFVGVNLRRGEMTFFVPMNKILEFLGLSATTRHSAADAADKPASNRHSAADATDKPDPNSWALLYEGLDMCPHDRSLFKLWAKYGFEEVYRKEGDNRTYD